MRLEHINLVVRDIAASLRLYQAAFPHWQVRGGGISPWDGQDRRWLHFGDQFSYLALYEGGSGDNEAVQNMRQVGVAHFGFETANLDALIQRLAQAGFRPSSDGADDPVRRNIYFQDADGLELEFVQYLSDEPGKRNRYADSLPEELDSAVSG